MGEPGRHRGDLLLRAQAAPEHLDLRGGAAALGGEFLNWKVERLFFFPSAGVAARFAFPPSSPTCDPWGRERFPVREAVGENGAATRALLRPHFAAARVHVSGMCDFGFPFFFTQALCRTQTLLKEGR